MPMRQRRTFAPVLLVAASIVSGCVSRAPIQPAFPPAADLRAPEKPRPTPAIVESEQAALAYDNAIEAWGDDLAAKVGRLCRWAKAMGQQDLECPPFR